MVAAGLVGYSCSPEPTAFAISTHIAGWMGAVGLVAVVLFALGVSCRCEEDPEEEEEEHEEDEEDEEHEDDVGEIVDRIDPKPASPQAPDKPAP